MDFFTSADASCNRSRFAPVDAHRVTHGCWLAPWSLESLISLTSSFGEFEFRNAGFDGNRLLDLVAADFFSILPIDPATHVDRHAW